MQTQSFGLDDILSITTGRLISRSHIDGVYKILQFMCQTSLFTHQLGRAARICGPYLLEQFPNLVNVKLPEGNFSQEELAILLTSLEEMYGTDFPVTTLPEGLYESKDPFVELQEQVGNKPIIPVVV